MNFFGAILQWLENSMNRYQEQRFQNHFENVKDIADVERILRELRHRNPGAFL